jgi:2-desacetyl-2-hydroxyethyl bacteriochlorophyllide A dehydrogenase
MRRLRWLGNREFEYTESAVKPPLPAEGEVRIQVGAVGVCGTDIHIIDGHISNARPPLVLGHEISGTIDAIGEGVTNVRPGDRVTVDQVVGCETCFFCRRGSVQFCQTGYELGFTRDGACQDFIVLPAANVYRIPDSISMEEAAVLDMEVWGALHKAGDLTGAAVLVIGDGPIGMIACQLARATGAVCVILSGRCGGRMRIARQLNVADQYVDAGSDTLQDIVELETDGCGVDLAIDCAGTQAAVEDAIRGTMPGGRVVLFGVHTKPASGFDLNPVVLKDLIVYGSVGDRRGWHEVIELASSGKLKIGPMITHRFALRDAPEAYETVRAMDGVMKAVIVL